MTSDDRARKPATLDDVRGLGTIPVWHPTKPDAADVLGCSRNLAYRMAERGEIPTIRLGSRVVVPVPALLRMLGEDAVLIADRAETAGQAGSSHEGPRVSLTDEHA